MYKRRSNHGQAVTILSVLLSTFVFGIFIMMTYEISRFGLVRSQLRTSLDAAARAGELTLSSQQQPSDELRRTAEAVALNVFKKNTIGGASMEGTTIAPSLDLLNPSKGRAELLFEHNDYRSGSRQGQRRPNSRDEIYKMRVTAAYDCPLFSGFFLGSSDSSYKIVVSTTTSLQKLDLMIAFDLSNSMDDETFVTMVDRHWSHSSNPPRISYDVSELPNSRGKISELIGAPFVGTALNALPPQNLESAFEHVRLPRFFSEIESDTFSTRGLRGADGDNSPPGDMKAAFSHYPKSLFTDMVVNLDGSPEFDGATVRGFQFPTVATLVEASRGNLESENTVAAAHLTCPSPALPVKPRAGYQDAYNAAALERLEPLRSIEKSLVAAVESVEIKRDCRIGLVAFADTSGSALDSTVQNYRVSRDFPQGGMLVTAQPFLKLKPGADGQQSLRHFLTPSSQRSSAKIMMPTGTTNTADALDACLNELTGGSSRDDAKKAILLVTDGIATQMSVDKSKSANADALDLPGASDATQEGRSLAGIAGDESDLVQYAPCAASREQARRARNLGIPIFVLAINHGGAEMARWQDEFYSHDNANAKNGGIAAISSRRARYRRVDWSNSKETSTELNAVLKTLFAQVTRRHHHDE